MMGMGLSLSHRMVLLCSLCKTNAGNDEDHNPACPKARMKAAVAANPSWDCPRCAGKVEVTLDDYLECRKCRRIYCTGYVALGFNPDTLPEAYLHQNSPVDKIDTYTKVLVLPKRAKQKRFRLDDTLAKIKADIPNWKIRNF